MGFSLDELEPIITVRYPGAGFDPDAARTAAALSAYPLTNEGREKERNSAFNPYRIILTPRQPAVDESWREQAACKGMPTSLWFPDRGEASHEADAICAGCPVRVPCAEYGMGEQHGVWGGLHDRDRRRVRASRRAPVSRKPVVPVACGTVAGYRKHHRDEGKCDCKACLEAYARYRTSIRKSRAKQGDAA